MASYLTYSIEDREGVKLVNLTGNISSITRDELVDTVNKITAKNNAIVNLRDVELITSSGLNALVEISTEARKNARRVLILGLRESTVKLIDRLDLYEYFIFVESIEEGLMKLRYFILCRMPPSRVSPPPSVPSFESDSIMQLKRQPVTSIEKSFSSPRASSWNWRVM